MVTTCLRDLVDEKSHEHFPVWTILSLQARMLTEWKAWFHESFMPEKSWSLSFDLSPLKAVMDLNGAHGPWTKNKSISTDLMQYDVVVVVKGFPARRVPSCFSCPMFSVLLSARFRIEFLDRWNFRLRHSGALKCKRFNYTGLSGGWLCWKRFELGQLWPACQKHNLISEGTLWKTLWASLGPTKAVFERDRKSVV